MNTHETYVSLETAKLLKKAGFDWRIYDGYILYENDNSFVTQFQTPHNFNGNNGDLFNNYLHHKEILSRPTLSVAQKWLREVKNMQLYIPINIDWMSGKDNLYDIYNIAPLYYFILHQYFPDKNKYGYIEGDFVNTYEEALEAGIKKCLEIILENK